MNLAPISDAAAYFHEIVGELHSGLTSHSDIGDHEALKVAAIHGIGYLTGNAAGCLTSLEDTITGAEFESTLMDTIGFCILAIISARLDSAAAIADEDEDGGPSGDDQTAVLPMDEFITLMHRLGVTTRPVASLHA